MVNTPPQIEKEFQTSKNDSEKPSHIDLFPSGQLPKFSIRDYAFRSRSRFGIENCWPYAAKTLETCLKNGLRNPLPPFESPQDIRKLSGGSVVSETVLSEPPELVLSEPSLGTLHDDDAGCSNLDPPILADSLPTRNPPESEAEVLPEVNRTTANPVAKKDSPVKSFMGSKVCPVCQKFSSSSNTAMNAHVDGCLAGVGEAPPIGSSPSSPPSTSKDKMKMKSVAEIYRRSQQNSGVRDGLGDAYVDETGAKVRALSKSDDQTQSPPPPRNRKEEREYLSQLLKHKTNESSSRPRRSCSKINSGEDSSARSTVSLRSSAARVTGESSLSSPKKRTEKPSPELPLIRKRLRRASTPNQEDSSAAKRRKSSAGPGPKSNLKRKALMKSACKKSARVGFSSEEESAHHADLSCDMELGGEEPKEPEAPVPDVEVEQDPVLDHTQAHDQAISNPDSQVPADKQQKESETGGIEGPIDMNLNVVPVSEEVAETSERPTLDLNASLDDNANFVQLFDAKLKLNVADDGKGQKSPPTPMIRLMGKDLVVVNNQEPELAECSIAQIPEIIIINDDEGPQNEPAPGLMQQPAAPLYNPPPDAFRAFWMEPTNAGLNLNPPPAMVHGPNQTNQSPNPPLNLK